MEHTRKPSDPNSGKANAGRPAERLLVVSENQELSSFLKNEIAKNNFNHPLKVDFCYTAYNHNPEGMIEIGAHKIDMKDDAAVNRILGEYDLVFSLHCKQIFPKRLVENIRCINFHPGFNPYNRGWFSQAFSIINGLPIGATIHLMDPEVDHGKIIDQETVGIAPSDTSLEVYRKVIAAEKNLIRKNIYAIVEGTFHATTPLQEGNYNSLQDYQKLCKLKLDSVGTLQEHLNILRATSHGDYQNAYFTDANGKKYFVKIVIEESP